VSLTLSDLKLFGSATMALDESTTAIGGAIDTSKKVDWSDISGLFQAVSSSASDTTQGVTVYYRDSSGVIQNEAHNLNGTTPVTFTGTADRVLRAVKGATSNGVVALENQTATRSNTAQAGSANTITLDAGASAVDQAYLGMVIRLTGGSGSGQIAEIIDYQGSTKVATVSDYWRGTVPTGTTTFRIATGMVFDKLPSEVTDVRRPFYNAAAPAVGGSATSFYEKIFYKNASNSAALLLAQIAEASEASGKISFGVTAALDDSTTNGGGNNRQVAPGGISFNTTQQWVPGSTLSAGSVIGVWLRLALSPGDAATNESFQMQLSGQSA
jgi:hypothetical protein